LAVEGHSDSMGPAIINDKLSTERALAIKNYLVTNQVLAEDKIKAEGFGANRPIATNDNWQGRRKNRRIDIIMEL
jgi:outer membrane protein OmpA-like peptidoglycan-associated protein